MAEAGGEMRGLLQGLLRHRVAPTLCFLAACLIAAMVPLLSTHPRPALSAFPGWPERFEDRPLRQLPLTPLERRFAESFPGRIGRFSDGKREIIFRWVPQETRKLHPAIDCFRGGGYRVTPRPIDVGTDGTRWGSFTAVRGKQSIGVRERIHDAAGNGWTDVSSWYWAASRGSSRGPWWAVTVAEGERR